jgi:hypothetical protein
MDERFAPVARLSFYGNQSEHPVSLLTGDLVHGARGRQSRSVPWSQASRMRVDTQTGNEND